VRYIINSRKYFESKPVAKNRSNSGAIAIPEKIKKINRNRLTYILFHNFNIFVVAK